MPGLQLVCPKALAVVASVARGLWKRPGQRAWRLCQWGCWAARVQVWTSEVVAPPVKLELVGHKLPAPLCHRTRPASEAL